MHDPADHAAIVFALDAAHIRRQVRSNPSPLLIAQPKQILAHDPDPLQKTNQDRIVTTQELMSSDPSFLFQVGQGATGRMAVPRETAGGSMKRLKSDQSIGDLGFHRPVR